MYGSSFCKIDLENTCVEEGEKKSKLLLALHFYSRLIPNIKS